MKDIEINQQAKLKHIADVATKYDLAYDAIFPHGKYLGKIIAPALDSQKMGKLILVTAINPTPPGEGKTTTSIGLCDALASLGYKSVLALREPSLGPVFGRKGGATGGGYSQIAPLEDINLHFTGDIHAITTANNLIAAAIDNSIYWGNPLKIKKVLWKRCLDLNDRALRDVHLQISKAQTRTDNFQITAASEIMAIFCLASDLNDLENRLNRIIIGLNADNEILYLKALNITGSLIVLLQKAFHPNIVQTLENNLAFVHGGPFANIAHGCNSLVATRAALQVGDYVITEAGFGADLGAEKFLNIKCRLGKLNPNLVVIVATIRALKYQGGQNLDNILTLNTQTLAQGLLLLEKYVANIINFELPVLVVLNEFTNDNLDEKRYVKTWAEQRQIPFVFSNTWAEGSRGGQDFANLVINTLRPQTCVKFTYHLDEAIKTKISKVAREIYGAQEIEYTLKAEKAIRFLEANHLDKQFICMVKTPMSITDDILKRGLVKDWTLHVQDVTISNGAAFIVVHCGNIFTMPGLPRKPQAETISWDGHKVVGLN